MTRQLSIHFLMKLLTLQLNEDLEKGDFWMRADILLIDH